MTAPSGGCVRVGKATSSTQRTFDPRCDTFDVRVRSTQIPADFGQEPLESAYTLLAQRDRLSWPAHCRISSHDARDSTNARAMNSSL